MEALHVLILILAILPMFHYSQSQIAQTFLLESTSPYNHPYEKLDVFERGKFQVTNLINVDKSQYFAPEPLLIVSPKSAGIYPVLFFIHGTMVLNRDYSDLFKHIASHGYIVVAPKLFESIFFVPSQAQEIKRAATVINWLPSNLQSVLQGRVSSAVQADIQKLAVSGHSRGGKSAFALALGMSETKLRTKISALIGVDPVAGLDIHTRQKPYVLNYIPNSFNLSIPVTVIGTGLGSAGTIFNLACAPGNVSHKEFFNECRDSSHFVIAKYGHMQMLDDHVDDIIASIMSGMCKSGPGPKSTMRRTLGGIMVAFLEAYFMEKKGQYFALLANTSLAPTSLIVNTKGNITFAPNKYV